jgi:hypothetical protein
VGHNRFDRYSLIRVSERGLPEGAGRNVNRSARVDPRLAAHTPTTDRRWLSRCENEPKGGGPGRDVNRCLAPDPRLDLREKKAAALRVTSAGPHPAGRGAYRISGRSATPDPHLPRSRCVRVWGFSRARRSRLGDGAVPPGVSRDGHRCGQVRHSRLECPTRGACRAHEANVSRTCRSRSGRLVGPRTLRQ